MEIYFSRYILSPLRQANHLTSLNPKEGILVKGVLNGQTTFADYFPHIAMGDRSCEDFLENFKSQDTEYYKKVFHLLLQDKIYQKMPLKEFYNHQLWTNEEDLKSKHIKYKLYHAQDTAFLRALELGIRVRLDGCVLFNRQTLANFLSLIPEDKLKLIDYIEDPCRDINWEELGVPAARDFIKGFPFTHNVHKPNCVFIQSSGVEIIFSSYLGSDFGRWHAYCELVKEGDLSLVHGIVTEGYYKEQRPFFKGDFHQGFMPDPIAIQALYQSAHNQDWKLLCSM